MKNLKDKIIFWTITYTIVIAIMSIYGTLSYFILLP